MSSMNIEIFNDKKESVKESIVFWLLFNYFLSELLYIKHFYVHFDNTIKLQLD